MSLNRSAAASASALDGLDSYEALEGAYISGRSDSQSLVGRYEPQKRFDCLGAKNYVAE